jgi:putative transposase
MPARGAIKIYRENSIYHIYNRGVEKRKIFLDEQDYKVFLTCLKQYLSNPETEPKRQTLQGQTLQYHASKNYYGEIELLSFCLMPNHIHLLINQKDKDSIKKFTQSLFTRYSIYFNRKYKRSGPLFQGRYKATNVINKDYLLDVSRYIHKNPLKYTKNLVEGYSSYSTYLGLNNTSWVNKNIVLDYFNESTFMKHNNVKSYKEFVEKFKYVNEDIDLSSDQISIQQS